MENVDIYIIAGQSNALGTTGEPSSITATNNDWNIFNEYCTAYSPLSPSNNLGWGPGFGVEMTLADELSLNGKSGYIAKMGWSGRGLGKDPNQTDFHYESEELLKTMRIRIFRIKEMIEAQGDTPIWKGMIWIQGEQDCKKSEWSSKYAHNMEELIRQVREQTNTPEMPVAMLDLYSGLTKVRYTYLDIVRDQMRYVSAKDKDVYMIESDDLILHDVAHYNAFSMELLGRRFANLFLNIG